MLAPVILFAFNRLEPLKACVDSLLHNPEAAETDLIVFVDGPRVNREGEAKKVETVRQFASSIKGFRKVETHFSDSNKGLANSIIGGVTTVIEMYGCAIVLEDDLYVAPSFLSYMNTMLTAYASNEEIMQISGYSSKIRNYKHYKKDFYLSGRAHSWSWATWKDRWASVDWEVSDFDKLASSKEAQRAFCKYGSDLYGMLRGWKFGRNNSWYIRFDYSMHKQGKYCISPIRSLVRNDGFGPEATHTSVYDRYKIDFDTEEEKTWIIPKELEFNEKLAKHAVRYWSIPYRVYGKIMTKIFK